MADLDSNASPLFRNIVSDDSTYVHAAMRELSFDCEFAELTIPQMQMALALALHLKLANARRDLWES
jgi:hypothetical protein